MRLKKMLLILVTVGLLLVAAAPLFAQSTSATLTGTVVDQSGAVVPGTSIVVVDVATNATRRVVTNASGYFAVTPLEPGHYRLRAQHVGFTTVDIPDITLHTNDRRDIEIKLKVGTATQSLTVNGNALAVNTSPSVSTTIDRRFVGNLPLNGRSFQSLILLTPGVTLTTTNFNQAGQFSVNGQRTDSNSFSIDGVSANFGVSNSNGHGLGGSMYGQLAGAYTAFTAGGGTNGLVSVDDLEEFKIQTSSYTAEYGRQPGGQIQVVTRSGANQFHGSLYDYLRNDAMDARQYFNQVPAPKPALRQNDFGGTFSGPVVIPGLYNGHNRTFFFFSYEGQRLRLPLSGISYVPSLRVRQEAAAGVQPLLNAFPLPTGPEILNGTTPSGWVPFNYGISNPSTLDSTSLRIDHTFNSKLTIFGRYNDSPSNSTSFAGLAYGNESVSNTKTLTLGATAEFTPRLINEFRFNYSSNVGQSLYAPATYGGAVPVNPTLLEGGNGGRGEAFFIFGGQGGIVSVGAFSNLNQHQINVIDNLTLVKGSHQFKFGIDYRRLSPLLDAPNFNFVVFTSEAGLSSGTAALAETAHFDTAKPVYLNFSAYAQDTWKVTPRLTLDYGLRWELNPAPTLNEGLMPAVVNGITVNGTTPNVSNATLAPAGTPFYKTYYTAFAPRFGVAYELNSTSGRETVLRGGFGVYYDLNSGGAVDGLPLLASHFFFGAPFPLPAADTVPPTISVPNSLPLTSTAYSNASNLQLPFTLQWNVALEQSLGTQQKLTLSYVGSAARRLLTTQELNFPSGYTTGPRPNPDFSNIYYSYNGPTSDYNSLQVQYSARLSSSLQSLVNYTWSHAIDQVSNGIGTLVLSRGNADFDVRHNLSAAVTYNLPGPKSLPVLKQLLSHWTMDGIIHAQSGQPVDISYSAGDAVVDGVLVTVRPNLVPGQPLYISDPSVPGGRRFNPAAFTTPPANPNYPGELQQGNFGRNVLRGLPLYQVDYTLGRIFPLTEKMRLQFKAEAFNIFNHPMFGGYGTSVTSPSTFGVPTTTLGQSLGGLSYLYQLGGPRSIQVSLRLSF